MQDNALPTRHPPDADFTEDFGPEPDLYSGVVARRSLAYLVDVLLIFVLLGVAAVAFFLLSLLSFGILSPVLSIAFPLVPLAYHTVLIGGSRSATIGMRLTRIQVRRLDGRPPDYLLAALQTILFYASISLLTPLVLLAALFNGRGRCLHDFVCGTVVVNAVPWPPLSLDPSARL